MKAFFKSIIESITAASSIILPFSIHTPKIRLSYSTPFPGQKTFQEVQFDSLKKYLEYSLGPGQRSLGAYLFLLENESSVFPFEQLKERFT